MFKKGRNILSHQRPALFLADLVAIICVCSLAYLLVGSTSLIKETYVDLLLLIGIFVLMNMLGLICFGVYKKLWRYANVQDFMGCILGIATGSLSAYLIALAARVSAPPILFVMMTCASLITVIGIRVVYKIVRDALKARMDMSGSRRAMIVGAGGACRILLMEMLNTQCGYRPICLVDDDPNKISRTMNDIPIYGPLTSIPLLCEKLQIHTIFIAIPSCSKEERKRIVSICSETACCIKVLPYVHEMLTKENLLGQAQNICIEDLLGRDPIRFDIDEITSFVQGRVCMVTGGGGSIGSELCRQIMSHQPKKLVIVDIYENNAYAIEQELIRKYGAALPLSVEIASVRDYQKMNRLFDMYKPDIVFHAAAHKHVPLMETAPEEAVKNNVIGTFNTAMLAEWYHCHKFVLISTDKAVNPTNVMGATKRCCEMIVQYMAQQSSGTDFVAVRFGNVLGSNGSVIPLFKKQIEAGGPVTVTHPDIIRYFMTIPEAVSLVLQAGSMAKGGEIFVLDMGEPVKITTLAENLIRLYGLEPNVDIAIEFMGLRPGEKLYEELLMDEEGLLPTCNKKIFIGNQIEVKPDVFIEKLAALKSKAEENNREAVVQALMDLVPTFTHNRIGSQGAITDRTRMGKPA